MLKEGWTTAACSIRQPEGTGSPKGQIMEDRPLMKPAYSS